MVVKKYLILLLAITLILTVGLTYTKANSKRKNIRPESQTKQQDTTISSTKNFNITAHSLTDPLSVWVIVNKHRPIPVDFVPELTVPKVKLRLYENEEQMQINTTTAPEIKKLFDGASQDGITLVFGSGYRSGKLQTQFYNDYVAKDGADSADTYSARPGYSEHQTGFSADISSADSRCHLLECWSATPEGKWLAENAYKFGFIIRYPKDKQSITGYQFEPWHIRFVGNELALQIHQTGKTLEEFFNLESAPNYN